MSPRHAALWRHLQQLEAILKEYGLWSSSPPAAEALASRLPFCADTLTYEQWLQWVCLPTFHAIIEQRGPLPHASGLQPMGEQCLQHLGRRQGKLLQVLGAIDRLIQSAQ